MKMLAYFVWLYFEYHTLWYVEAGMNVPTLNSFDIAVFWAYEFFPFDNGE